MFILFVCQPLAIVVGLSKHLTNQTQKSLQVNKIDIHLQYYSFKTKMKENFRVLNSHLTRHSLIKKGSLLYEQSHRYLNQM